LQQRLINLNNEANAVARASYKDSRFELDRLAETHRRILEAAGEGIYGLNRERRYSFVNPAAAGMLGFAQAELLAVSTPDCWRSRDADGRLNAEADCPICVTLAEGTAQSADNVFFERKDGSIFPVTLTSHPIIEHRRIIGVVVTFRDITQRKQEELALIQARDTAEAGNRAKSIFLANMSHELRTPMNGVMGMIDLALRRIVDPKQLEWLSKSKDSLQRMLTVVNDIIDFSKLEAERLPLAEHDFSLKQLIDDAMAMQELAAEAKNLDLRCEMAAALPERLSGDAFRLRQILLNLLGNACKFSDRGTITVRASSMEQDETSVLLRIEVEDQGIGISSEQQALLFQAFTQADGSMTRKYGGSGLGLIISKRLAQLMGGDVGMQSQEGHGSTFWFTARLNKSADPGAQHHAALSDTP
jgi:PAS domain S-box-containing protein